ncbi:MAG: LapA family protein [Desulfotomaculum sp.]|nr:LapA family protein [Desulfotomaculum sp.]
MQVYIILGLIFALAVAVFAVQNATAVDINFLGWSFSDISLVLVILSSAAGGALITTLFGLPKQLRTMMKMRELLAENQRLARELNELKSVTGKEDKETKQEKKDT